MRSGILPIVRVQSRIPLAPGKVPKPTNERAARHVMTVDSVWRRH